MQSAHIRGIDQMHFKQCAFKNTNATEGFNIEPRQTVKVMNNYSNGDGGGGGRQGRELCGLECLQVCGVTINQSRTKPRATHKKYTQNLNDRE